MRYILILAALSLAAGCATTPEEQSGAKVEERKPPASGTAGADTRAVQPPKVAAVDLTKPRTDSASVLKDPNNILSKRSIYYDLDKYDVKEEYRALVEAHAKYLRENPNMRILVQGNTDERGSREYNLALGQRRSDGLKRMLTLLGAQERQIEAVSLGEEKPQDGGHDEAAWSKNRRSDILYSGEF